VLQFPVASTTVVMSFLECRLPGVAFLTYRREDGSPNLDTVVFGSHADTVCDHPMAMRIKEDPSNPLCTKGSSIFGFDLRLVKDLATSATNDEHEVASFQLGATGEKVLQWWEARNSVLERVKAFTATDPSSEMMNIVGHEDERSSRKQALDSDAGFKEGGKKGPVSDSSTAPSSRDASASSPSQRRSGGFHSTTTA
jgi:hypothetical protein